MKFIIIIFSAAILFSCNNSNKEVTSTIADTLRSTGIVVDTDKVVIAAPSTIKESQILDKIAALPEFKKSNAYLDSLTDHKHGLASMIFKPTKDEKDYYVRVGYNGDQRFETYYNFYVDSSTLDIKIADPLSADIISLAEFRKREAIRH